MNGFKIQTRSGDWFCEPETISGYTFPANHHATMEEATRYLGRTAAQRALQRHKLHGATLHALTAETELVTA